MIKKYQLKNGMDVVLVKNTKAPVVSVQTWVHTGGADEDKGQEGISHFLEHLFFKGTEEYKVGEIATQVEGYGGQLNAYTTFDRTVFYVTISKEYKKVAYSTISQMMGGPLFNEDEIDKEREVVIEEIKRSLDSPHRQASRLLFDSMFKKHPYRVPVLGYIENIKNVTRDEIVEYYNSRYAPDNMTLLVVGDIDLKEAKEHISEYFGTIEARKLKKVKREKEPKIEKGKVNVKETSFEENILYLSWQIPNATHADILKLEVLALILGQGESSRLMKQLRIVNPVTNYTGASMFIAKDPGFFTISSSLKYENLEEALGLIKSEIDKIHSDLCEHEELSKAIVNFESDNYYAMETVDGVSGIYGLFEHTYGDYREFKASLKKIHEVTLADLRKVARKYLTPEKLNISFMTNGSGVESKKEIQKFLRKWRKQGLRKTIRKEVKEVKIPKIRFSKSKDEFKSLKLKSGANLIYRSNSENPIVSMKAAFLGGLRFEKEGQYGVSELLSRVWSCGSTNYKEEELYRLMDGCASRFSSFGGRNTVGLSAVTMGQFINKVAPVFLDALINPSFHKDIVEREKVFQLEKIRKREDNPSKICVLQFMADLFGQHPYSRDILGEDADVQSLTDKKISSYLNGIMSSENLTVVLSGQFDVDKWVQHFESAIDQLPKKKIIHPQFKINELDKNKNSFNYLDKEQSHIVLGYRGLKFTQKERYVLDVLISILSGQGGRLFLELRDKHSLAYTVSPIRMDGIDTGYFGGYIGCSPEKAKKSIELLKKEFSKLANEKVAADELEMAKRNLVGRHDIGLQKTSSITGSILFDAIYGLPYDDAFNFKKSINSVTAESIRSLAAKIVGQKEVISVVGRVNPFE